MAISSSNSIVHVVCLQETLLLIQVSWAMHCPRFGRTRVIAFFFEEAAVVNIWIILAVVETIEPWRQALFKA
jgi:hypothetical protein